MTFDLKKEYDIDPKKELEGVWEPLGGGAEVLVAAWNNPKFDKALADQPRQIRRRMDRGKLSDEEDREIMVVVVADTILLDWKHIADDGKDVKYSNKAAIDRLASYPRFFRDIVAIANDESRYLREDEEDSLKNS